MHHVSRVVCAALCLALASALPASAWNDAYRFTRLVDVRDGFDKDYGLGAPALNDRGEVAFEAKRGPRVAIFRSNGRKLTSIADVYVTGELSDFAFFFGPPSLNDRGEVAFWTALEDGEAILRGRGGSLRTIAETPLGPFEFFVVTVSLNNRGEVAFGADLDDGDEGIFLGRGGQIHPLSLRSFGPLGGDAVPSVNDRGQVAFSSTQALDRNGDGVPDAEREGIFLRRSRKTISNEDWFVAAASNSGPLDQFIGAEPSLNRRGAVAFKATTDAGAEGIFLARKGLVTRIADTDEFPFLSAPSLNDRGRVAFIGAFGDETERFDRGLFVTRGSSRIRVLRTGDRLDGSRVTGFGFFREGLNNRGQLAFWATLADGRVGIYLATPWSVRTGAGARSRR